MEYYLHREKRAVWTDRLLIHDEIRNLKTNVYCTYPYFI
jgi:hypothetical protein